MLAIASLQSLYLEYAAMALPRTSMHVGAFTSLGARLSDYTVQSKFFKLLAVFQVIAYAKKRGYQLVRTIEYDIVIHIQ